MLTIMAKSRARRERAEKLFSAISARAREPVFFAELHVPDTIDGRFDLLVLHAFLVLEHLRARGERELLQSLTDRIFLALDESLRELGSGDIGMGRKMKSMANAFYGRLDAYQRAADEATLTLAVRRNIFREQEGSDAAARAIARYAARARAALANVDVTAGVTDFGSLPD
jgi:cytochrome b pre-mRNA-processing protein 3